MKPPEPVTRDEILRVLTDRSAGPLTNSEIGQRVWWGRGRDTPFVRGSQVKPVVEQMVADGQLTAATGAAVLTAGTRLHGLYHTNRTYYDLTDRVQAFRDQMSVVHSRADMSAQVIAELSTRYPDRFLHAEVNPDGHVRLTLTSQQAATLWTDPPPPTDTDQVQQPNSNHEDGHA